MLSMLSKKFFYFWRFNNRFTKCVFAYPYSPMYPYSILWSYRCGKSKQVVLLAHGRLSFLGRIESRGVLESPIMNFFLLSLMSYLRKQNLLIASMTIYVWAENPGPNAGNSVNQLPLLAAPCKTKTDGSPLARGAFTRLSFSPVIT
jgi:hypothetical protein